MRGRLFCKFCGKHKVDVKPKGYGWVVLCYYGECPGLPETYAKHREDAVQRWKNYDFDIISNHKAKKLRGTP